MPFQFTAATWNIQRGRTVTPASTAGAAQAAARHAGLQNLLLRADVLLLQEPGMDLRAAPLGGLVCHRDSREDNQSETSACRPQIYVTTGTLTEVRLRHQAGGDDAFRFPAAAVWEVAGNKVLLISLHATSGGGGSVSAQDLLDAVEDWWNTRSNGEKCPTVLVGADFNAPSGQFSTLLLPRDPTHQSGHRLDGFFVDRSDNGSQSITAGTPDLVPGFTLNHGDQPDRGCFFSGQRVSDHAPVIMQVTINDEGS